MKCLDQEELLNYTKSNFEIQINELEKVKNRMGNEIVDIANLIIESKGKVVITGIGKSGLIGKKISATLASTGTTAVFMNSAEGLHGDLGMISKEDVVIAISNSGNSDEVKNILPSIKKIGAKIIAMTGNKNSALGKESDYILDVGVEREACPMNLAPTCSTTATLVMGDVLASLLIKIRDFKPENFAVYHPGGSLGRRLLTRVKDVMHVYEKIPVINLEAPIEAVISEMTKKKLGAVCVVEDEKLKGIITEGDLRRSLINKGKFFDYVAKDIMTSNPITISENEMAMDALQIMEERENKISVLPVVEKGKLLGLINIHDLFGCK